MKRKPGRPPTGRAVPAAERARKYRVRPRARGVLRLLGKSAPAQEAGALRRAVDDFENIRLE